MTLKGLDLCQRSFVHALVVPFFMVLFPAVWYINRNLTTEELPPHIKPSTELVAVAIGVSVLGSIVFATVIALFTRESGESKQQTLPYRQRIFQPDSTALTVFFFFIALSFGSISRSWNWIITR